MSRFPKRVVLVAGLGLCLIPAAAALCWRPIVLRYHLWHLSHGPCAYRDAAFTYLLQWNELDDGSELARVDEVIVFGQQDGHSMLVVFQPDDDEDSEKGEREVWIFDHDAKFVYTGVVHSNGIKDLTGDGIDEFVMDSSWTIEESRHFEVFCVFSANQIGRPLLVVSCDERTDSWSCRPRPGGSPGVNDLEIGRGDDEDFVPAATYRWSPKSQAYVGPEEGEGQAFVRLEGWEGLWKFLGGSP